MYPIIRDGRIYLLEINMHPDHIQKKMAEVRKVKKCGKLQRR
jgi:hypothetical protein